ncbi:hypothetical protein WJX73_007286 [Symbiochloris irregularis]|uniref:Uncharacterized protein n=1 Tax=Symbiochloris irregularis TaxID=706552 RepID=A0AAW1NRW5_9CHLO
MATPAARVQGQAELAVDAEIDLGDLLRRLVIAEAPPRNRGTALQLANQFALAIYDGFLAEPEAPRGVYLSPIKFNNQLPTMTIFPRDGEKGAMYHRVAVPLDSLRLQEERFRMFLAGEELSKEHNRFFRFARQGDRVQWFVLERNNIERTWVNVHIVGNVSIPAGNRAWTPITRMYASYP